jgi:MFS transporter, ACS family, solute carrier family 17 (sodium-dependent inorganic phosphate cotransporter), other
VIFYVAGGIYLFGCVVYWFWAQGEIQPWAVQEADPDDSYKFDERESKMTGVSNPALDTRE